MSCERVWAALAFSVRAGRARRVLRGCLRVNATGLRVRFWFCGLMGVWVGGGGVFGVCGFRSPARAPCLSVR